MCAVVHMCNRYTKYGGVEVATHIPLPYSVPYLYYKPATSPIHLTESKMHLTHTQVPEAQKSHRTKLNIIILDKIKQNSIGLLSLI